MDFRLDTKDPKLITSIGTVLIFVLVHLFLMFANVDFAMSHAGILINAIIAAFAGQYLISDTKKYWLV